MNDVVAIDAEFVSLHEEVVETSKEGKRLIKPGRFGLARVSVIDARNTVDPLIDDYIATSEPIVDYLTRFSGIYPGDLDPKTSPYHVTTLKVSLQQQNLVFFFPQ
jgi:PAB-dependent poly(A)-specific ribonuclease subunit 2